MKREMTESREPGSSRRNGGDRPFQSSVPPYLECVFNCRLVGMDRRAFRREGIPQYGPPGGRALPGDFKATEINVPSYLGSSAFSLLEVVLALTVFALVVIPAIGLVALSYRNAETDLQAPNAVEIKSLLELELLGATDVFKLSFLLAPVEFYASQDLQEIAQDGAAMADSEKYYKVRVTSPTNYVYDEGDAYRVFLFNIIWPAFVGGVSNEENVETLQQLILPVVLSK
jgi:hypothetical protein